MTDTVGFAVSIFLETAWPDPRELSRPGIESGNLLEPAVLGPLSAKAARYSDDFDRFT